MITIRPATLRDACFVAASMREQDRIEIAAVVSMDEPAQVAALLLHNSGDMAFCAFLHGQPVACFGIARLFDHVASGWAFGTKRMRRVVPAMTRHCLAHVAPTLVERGFRRLEIRAMVENELSCRWIAGLGLKRETEPFEYGRHGEMFVMFGIGLEQWLTRRQ